MTRAPQDAILTRLLADGIVSTWVLVDEIQPGADDTQYLRVCISRLRDRLGQEAIDTIRGVGYRLTEIGRRACSRMEAV